MPSQLKSWGKPYSPSIRYSADLCCEECNWSFAARVAKGGYHENVVGFTLDPPRTSANPQALGALMIECPECFSKFWFHESNELVGDIIAKKIMHDKYDPSYFYRDATLS